MSRKDQLANFTASLNSLYQEEVIQGVEMDWEWPLDTHDKKDKIKLIRYMRQMKLATGGDVQRRLIRSAETTTLTLDEDENKSTENPEEAETTTALTESETHSLDWSSMREDNIEETTSSSNVGEETTENWRKRGFVRRKRIKKPKSTTVAQETDTEMPNFLDHEDRKSVV